MLLLSSLEKHRSCTGWISGAKWGNIFLFRQHLWSLLANRFQWETRRAQGWQAINRGQREKMNLAPGINFQSHLLVSTNLAQCAAASLRRERWGGEAIFYYGKGTKAASAFGNVIPFFLPTFILRLLVMPFPKKPALLALKCLSQDGASN